MWSISSEQQNYQVPASLRNSFLTYTVLLAAHIALVWLLPYFPSQDGPSHIYNLVILHDLLNGGKEWGSYFSTRLHAVPNLGFNLVAVPLLQFLPPLAAEKMFITLYLVLMAVSVPVLMRSFGRPALPFSFLVFPVMFNFTLLMGFYSYVLAVPLFLLAFALAWKVRDRSILCRFICFNLAGLVIYSVHLIPFALYLLSLGAIIIGETKGYKNTGKKLLQLSLLVSPLLLSLMLYLRTGTTKTSWDYSYLLAARRITDLLMDLRTFSTVSFFDWQLLPGKILMMVVMSIICLTAVNVILGKFQKTGCGNGEKTLLCMASGMLLIYFYGPFRFGDGCFFNQRFPWVILLIALPLLQIPEWRPMQRAVMLVTFAVACIFLVVNSIALKKESAKIEQFLSGLSAEISKGTLVATYKSKGPAESRVDALLHAASYYGVIKGCVDVGNYETGFNYFPVKFNETLPAMPSQDQVAFAPETIDWSNYPSIQFLLGWEMSDRESKKINRFFHLVWKDEPFTLWKRNGEVKVAVLGH